MDALEVAIITVFISAICCIIYVTAVSTLNSYNISVGVFKCVKYVIQNPGSSIVVTVYTPYSVHLKVVTNETFIRTKEGGPLLLKTPPYTMFCVGESCVNFTNLPLQIAIYSVSPVNVSAAPQNVTIEESKSNNEVKVNITSMLYLPSGVYTIKCMSYWNYTDNKRFLQVIITLYR